VLTDKKFLLFIVIRQQPSTPPALSIKEHVSIEQISLAMNENQTTSNIVLKAVPVVEVKAQPAKRTLFITNQSM
jgi:hypothetical protein